MDNEHGATKGNEGAATEPAGALWTFAQLVEPGDCIEYSTCGDGSASLTAVRDRVRVLTLTLGGWQAVYDLTKMDEYLAGRPGYRVYPPEGRERCENTLEK